MVALSRRHTKDPTLNLEKILQGRGGGGGGGGWQLAKNLTHKSREP